jgi:glycerol-3-phosphate acyltransferase PlsY
MAILAFISAVALSYIIGSIPTSYIFGRAIKGIDIRKHGSGNVGATNLIRTVGKVPGITALILDVIKGIIPPTLIAELFYKPGLLIDKPLFKVILGLCVVSGHIWTIFLRFKGGKGVATTIGVFIGLAPLATAIGLIIWVVVVLIFRYVSLASIAMAISLPIIIIIGNNPPPYIILSVILLLFIIYKHIPNIKRIIEGREYKIWQKGKK